MIKYFAHRRVVITVIDQSLSSASNFMTGVVIARLSGIADFGAYILTLMIWLIVVGLHRALVTEPLIVSARDTDDRRALLAAGVSSELLLGAAVSVVVAAGGLITLLAGSGVGALMLALSPWFPALLVQDYWRAMAFQQRRPGMALANDLVFIITQIVLITVFLLLGWTSATYIITAWGIGATAGALFGFLWFPAIGRPAAGWHLVKSLWPQSRWMLADFLTGFSSEQGYLAFAALLLTATDYGGFRAAFGLMGPTVVIFLAGGNIGLPEASHRYDPENPAVLRHFASRLTGGVVACTAIYGGIVALNGERILSAIYGPEFVKFGHLAALAVLQYIVLATTFGGGITLKVVGRMRRLWRLRVTVAAVSLISMVGLVRWLGTAGAAWAGVTMAASYSVGLYVIYRSEMRKPMTTQPTTSSLGPT